MVYLQTKNLNLGKFLEGLGIEKVGIFYHMYIDLEYVYILRPFGTFYGQLVILWQMGGYLVYFPPCWYIVTIKIWHPCSRPGWPSPN
jgi:hypothetical protein